MVGNPGAQAAGLGVPFRPPPLRFANGGTGAEKEKGRGGVVAMRDSPRQAPKHKNKWKSIL
jgi:hypothetical protein